MWLSLWAFVTFIVESTISVYLYVFHIFHKFCPPFLFPFLLIAFILCLAWGILRAIDSLPVF